MGIRIDMDMEGERVLSRNLRVMADNISDYSPVMEHIGEDIKASTLSNFDTESSEREGRWADLKPETIRQKRRQWYTGWKLVRTGKMKRGFEYEHDSLSVRIKNDVEYFRFHQRGTPHLPRRMMMELKKQDRQEIIRRIQNYIYKQSRTFRRY